MGFPNEKLLLLPLMSLEGVREITNKNQCHSTGHSGVRGHGRGSLTRKAQPCQEYVNKVQDMKKVSERD